MGIVVGHPVLTPFAGWWLTSPLASVKADIAELRISQPALDLLSNLLSKQPGKRASARDVLRHPWVCGYEDAPRSPFPAAISPQELNEAVRKYGPSVGCGNKGCALM